MSAVSSLEGRICVVTGASRGIGKGIALALCRRGATVYITGRTLHAKTEGVQALGSLTRTAEECSTVGGRCIPVACDHSDDASTQALFDKVQREQGRLDLLVNNAYAGAEIVEQSSKKFFEKPLHYWDASHVVGLRSHYACAWYAARMMTQNVSQECRLIVNISSAAGLGYFFDVAYGVGKAAVDRLASDMAVELREFNIACVSLWPGAVKTEYLLQQGSKIGEQQYQEDAMESPEFSGMAVAALLADPNIMAKTGTVIQSAEVGRDYKFVDTDGRSKKPLVPTKALDAGLAPMLRKKAKGYAGLAPKAPASKL